MSKIDEDVTRGEDFGQTAGNFDIFSGQAHYFTHVLAHGGMPGFFKGRGQNNVLGPFQHVNNAAAHASGRTCDNCLDHKAPVVYPAGAVRAPPLKSFSPGLENYFINP